MSSVITNDVVTKVAKLANLKISPDKTATFSQQLEPILEHFDSLNKINVTGVQPTYQVTGLNSVLREDVIDSSRTFTQKQALANASKSKNGYFVTAATIKK